MSSKNGFYLKHFLITTLIGKVVLLTTMEKRMKLNDLEMKKLLKEAFECANTIEKLLSSVDAKLAAKSAKAA